MNVNKFSKFIKVAINKMAAGEKANPVDVIAATGTDKLHPEQCAPDIAFFEYGYCDPYFGWLVPAEHEAVLLLEKFVTSERLANQLWENPWTRAFLVSLYERNDEKWFINEDCVPELEDKLGYKVRTREGFVQWVISGELYGYRLPGHESIIETKDALDNVRG